MIIITNRDIVTEFIHNLIPFLVLIIFVFILQLLLKKMNLLNEIRFRVIQTYGRVISLECTTELELLLMYFS